MRQHTPPTSFRELLDRYELWDETLRLADTMVLDPTDAPAEQVKRLRLIGLAHAGKGDREKLGQTIALLQKQASKGKTPDPKLPDPKGKGKGFPGIEVLAGKIFDVRRRHHAVDAGTQPGTFEPLLCALDLGQCFCMPSH